MKENPRKVSKSAIKSENAYFGTAQITARTKVWNRFNAVDALFEW